jgi:4-carboxymuconolactone decarboxylase
MRRMPYVDIESATEEVQRLAERLPKGADGKTYNVFRMMATSPDVLLQFMRMGTSILQRAQLNAALRELAILRNAQLTRAVYEYAHHVPIALEAGVTQEQIDNLGKYHTHAAFSEKERAVLAYAEEVSSNVQVADTTFEAVANHLSNVEVFELTIATGFYGLVSRALEAFEVRPEPEFEQYAPAGWESR